MKWRFFQQEARSSSTLGRGTHKVTMDLRVNQPRLLSKERMIRIRESARPEPLILHEMSLARAQTWIKAIRPHKDCFIFTNIDSRGGYGRSR